MSLTSIDYAQLIQYAAYNMYRVVLNRTQINKILFFVYGTYLARSEEGAPLFEDDTPKAWPYGPVFPRVNKRIVPENIPMGFPSEKTAEFRKNELALNIVKEAVQKMHGISAYKLTEWSHQEGSPWYKTVFQDKENQSVWNTRIEDNLIKDYFKQHNS